MEKLLSNLLEGNTLPVFSAFVLGLMTAISPCPLATNITAIGYIGREISNKNKVFINGLIYTAGRTITYVSLAVIIYLGADQFRISGFFQQYGERFLGPLLIILGIFLLGIIKINFPSLDRITVKYGKKVIRNYRDVLFLGILFALAFCPYSGVLFFGMLIPLMISKSSLMLLPFIYAVATGIPVIIIAWLLAFAISGIGKFYSRLKNFELWFRKAVAILFIITGTYYLISIYA